MRDIPIQVQAQIASVARRNMTASHQTGLIKAKHERLDLALAHATEDPIERSLLPDDVIATLREKGCETAAQAALWRLRDSLDPTHNAKFWNLVLSRMPKRVEHVHRDLDLSEIPTDELLAHLGAVDASEVGDSAENDTSEKPSA